LRRAFLRFGVDKRGNDRVSVVDFETKSIFFHTSTEEKAILCAEANGLEVIGEDFCSSDDSSDGVQPSMLGGESWE
jgi:hypothetical protein